MARPLKCDKGKAITIAIEVLGKAVVDFDVSLRSPTSTQDTQLGSGDNIDPPNPDLFPVPQDSNGYNGYRVRVTYGCDTLDDDEAILRTSIMQSGVETDHYDKVLKVNEFKRLNFILEEQ